MVNLKKIRGIRRGKNLTQRECAAAIGVGTAEYTKKEKGVNKFSDRQLSKLAGLFNVDVGVLFNDNKGDEGGDVMPELLRTKTELIEVQKKQIQMLEQRNAELEQQLLGGKKKDPK